MKTEADEKTQSNKKYTISTRVKVSRVLVIVLIAGSLFSSLSLLQSWEAIVVLAQKISKVKEGLQIGNIAPDFKITDPQRGIITKQTFAGKPLFIFFTATYCTACQIGAENLARYDDETRGSAFNVLVVFIDDSETDSQFIEWKQQYGRSDWYIAKGIDMTKSYNVQHMDTKYLFDNNGIIKWFDDIRPLEYKTAKQILDPVLKSNTE